MKNILFLFLLFATSALAQKQNQIETLLNKELTKELKLQRQDSYYETDPLLIIQPYKIENNILSLTIQKKSNTDKTYISYRQEIALDKILTIIKDINVIFETEKDAVKIYEINSDGEVSYSTYDLFFLQLSAEKNNEILADNLVKMFKKNGFTIEKRVWYD